MNVPTVIAAITVVYGIGSLIDYMLRDQGIKQWQKTARLWWEQLGSVRWSKMISWCSTEFINLFDAIYGHEWLSLKRFIRSIASTSIAVTAIATAVGYKSTWIFGKAIYSPDYTLLSMMIVNYLADYISLQETRWIMGLARDQNFAVLTGLFLLDIILTSLIFLLSWHLFLLIPEFRWNVSDVYERFLHFSWSIQDGTGVFFWGTFFTSALWFAFVVIASSLKVAEVSSEFMRVLLGLLSASQRPGRLVASFFSSLIIIIFMITVAMT